MADEFSRPDVSESELQEWRTRFFEMNPSMEKLRGLVVAWAERRGGRALAFFQARFGYYWGRSTSMTFEEAASVSGLSREAADSVFSEMLVEVWPKYRASGD